MRTKMVLLGGLLLLAVSPASASIILYWPPFTPTLLRNSEIIVVGETGPARFVWEEPHAAGPEHVVLVERYAVPVEVKRVIKGDQVPARMNVAYFVRTPYRQREVNGNVITFFPTVPANETCLLCLDRDVAGFYCLTRRSGWGAVISVGRAMPKPRVKPKDPLDALIAQFLFSASAEDIETDTRVTCLNAVEGLSYYACPYDEQRTKTIPTGDGEDFSAEQMREVVKQRIWPRLLDVTRSKDAKVVRQAWISLAHLQYPAAVPALAALARREDHPANRGWVAGAIGRYRCSSPGLTELLNPLLSDEDTDIRTAAARSLAKVADKSSTGHLVAALDDENEEVRRLAVCALSGIVGDGVCPDEVGFSEKEAELIQFWKDWAANHPEQVRKE
jgi:hypothetical protein